MNGMINKLLDCCVPPNNQKMVRDLISNEMYHYIPPQHNSDFLKNMWSLGQAINNCFIVEIGYCGMTGIEKRRRLQPVGIMFSAFYFYLVGFILEIDKEQHFRNPDDPYPTIYRIDRIRSLKVTEEHFSIPYRGL